MKFQAQLPWIRQPWLDVSTYHEADSLAVRPGQLFLAPLHLWAPQTLPDANCNQIFRFGLVFLADVFLLACIRTAKRRSISASIKLARCLANVCSVD